MEPESGGIEVGHLRVLKTSVTLHEIGNAEQVEHIILLSKLITCMKSVNMSLSK